MLSYRSPVTLNPTYVISRPPITSEVIRGLGYIHLTVQFISFTLRTSLGSDSYVSRRDDARLVTRVTCVCYVRCISLVRVYMRSDSFRILV